MQLSLVELWPAMGPLARAVMFLLLAMSVFSLAVAVERLLKLVRSARETEMFLTAWRGALARGGIATARGEAARFPRSYVAHLVDEASGVLATGAGDDPRLWLEAYDRTARRLIIASTLDAKRGLGIIATVASSAPFVGLFGTVIGIVTAFHAIGRSGQAGLGSVSSGIAEALVATAVGIMVAIPALWLFNHLTQRVQRLSAELECVAEELAVAALGESRRDVGRARNVVGR